jgi:formylglycine-generating enzyme required for sulfatase activity
VLSNPTHRARFDSSRNPTNKASTDSERQRANAAATESDRQAQAAKAEAQKARQRAEQAQRKAEEAQREAEARARQAEQARQAAETRAWQAEAQTRAQQSSRKGSRRRRSSSSASHDGLGIVGWSSVVMAVFGLVVVVWGIVHVATETAPVETALPAAKPQPAPVANREPAPPVQPALAPKPLPCDDCPKMLTLSGGHFLMGAADDDEESSPGEKPRHEVTVRPFRIAQIEVTQRLWMWAMNDNPSYLQGCMDCPVEKVSFEDVQAFLLRLNVMTGQNFRLPTEAEWEYACRGGAGNRTYCGDGEDPHTLAWYNHNADATRKVKTRKPNAFGLHDMSGNVWEWCEDYWHDDYKNATSDGSAWKLGGSADYRVVRGGSWNSKPQMLRAAARQRSDVSRQFNYLGFRLAQDLTEANNSPQK